MTSAVNVPAVSAEDMEALGSFMSLCRSLGRIAVALAEGSSIDTLQVEFLGRIAERDTRLLTIHVLLGALRGHTEEGVNEVSASVVAEARGIDVREIKQTGVRDYADLIRVSVIAGEDQVRVTGTLTGRRFRPHLLEAWGQRFDIHLEGHISLFRYRDDPGMIGRVGMHLGRNGINIVSAAAGSDANGHSYGPRQVMVIVTDMPVPPEVINDILATDGFDTGRTINLELPAPVAVAHVRRACDDPFRESVRPG